MRFKMMRAATLALALAVVASACGEGGGDYGASADKADRVVEVAMVDNAFDPSSLTVAEGETVTFKFTNTGAVAHDAFIGDASAQDEHGESMEEGDDMAGHNMEDGDALLLDPGQTGELTHTFDEAGEIFIGCHQPGHYEAGMKSTVTVS
ncbi:plastocyanin/azurin family copper-binding protein [soil metagenome]